MTTNSQTVPTARDLHIRALDHNTGLEDLRELWREAARLGLLDDIVGRIGAARRLRDVISDRGARLRAAADAQTQLALNELNRELAEDPR